MTLYVRNVGVILIGKPRKNPIQGIMDSAVRTQTFDNFLKNLQSHEKEILINVIESRQGLRWNGKVFAKDSTPEKYLKELVIRIIKNGAIPNDLDFNEIIGKIGTPARDYLEEGLFHLLQDTIMQKLNSR